ncbi:MAG: glycosyltransferase family 2 protein [Bryobacteraceae bacterium]
MNPLVTVSIVTHRSRRFVETCLASVVRQKLQPLEIIIVDNASTDGTAEWLEQWANSPAALGMPVRLIRNTRNVGFAAGQNQAIRGARGEWVLTLNPDVRLEEAFLLRLLSAARRDPRAGVVCGKLLRATSDFSIAAERRIDTTGIYFTRNLRHLDRGWDEPDDGRYGEPEYVFGACAAAALYRRDMIDDISLAGDFFDPDFFAYREDADIAWRAQLLGWRCIYTPDAAGWHIRGLKPGDRANHAPVLRMHSVKNRILMRINNMTGGLYRRVWLPATLRDILVLGGCLLSEPASIPAFWKAAGCAPRSLARRRQILARRRVDDATIAEWFSDTPVSRPLERGAGPDERRLSLAISDLSPAAPWH